MRLTRKRDRSVHIDLLQLIRMGGGMREIRQMHDSLAAFERSRPVSGGVYAADCNRIEPCGHIRRRRRRAHCRTHLDPAFRSSAYQGAPDESGRAGNEDLAPAHGPEAGLAAADSPFAACPGA